MATDHACEEAETSSDQILNQTDVVRPWDMSPRTLENWRWKGDGPPFLKVGHRVLYRLEVMETYEKQSIQTTSACISTKQPKSPELTGNSPVSPMAANFATLHATTLGPTQLPLSSFVFALLLRIDLFGFHQP
jgi:hypothetical protein